jgi:tetratricopeptide (TPR) repeat protein
MNRFHLLGRVLLLALFCSISTGTDAQENLNSLNVVCDGESWRLTLPYQGSWAHFAMNNPTRLVVDLIDGRSKLPLAPGLYVLEFEGGPVTRLRTSQYSSQPGKRRVRITLDLASAYRYEADKRTDELEIIIPMPAEADWGDPWHVTLDATGPHWEALGVTIPAQLETMEQPPAQELQTPLFEPRQPESRPKPGEEFSEAVLESLLSDSTLFEIDRSPLQTSWELAASRLLDDAQLAYLDGDTARAIEQLQGCERFYADTDPGQQATLLRSLILKELGREVEADIGPAPPEEGPWLMIYDSVMQKMLSSALTQQETGFAEEVLTVWQQTDPVSKDWAKGAIQVAETLLDSEKPTNAGKWVQEAMQADQDLSASPRALMLYAMINVKVESWQTADGILSRVEAGDNTRLAYRAKAVRGDIRYRTGSFGEAVPFYNQLVGEEAPKVEREWALYQLGNCWEAMGDLKRAEGLYQEVITAEHGNYWASMAKIKLARLKDTIHVANIK